MEGDTQQPGGYGPSQTAEQHRFRLEQMQMQDMNERLRRVEECVYSLKDMMRDGENVQRGRSSTGRFTSGPGRAGSPNRSYEEDDGRSMGYDQGYNQGRYDGYRDVRRYSSNPGYRPRQQASYPPPEHVHDVDGYSGPPVPYYPDEGQNMQHWRGYGHRGMWGYRYPDPYLAAYWLGSLQYDDTAAIN